MEPPRALLFDVFGTCVDWRSSVARELRALGERLDLGAVDWPALADAWRGLYQPQMGTVRRGERPWVNLDVLHREALDRVLDDAGLGAVPEAERAELTFAWHRLDPWPDAVAGLERLRRRFVVAPLSNGNIRLILDMARRAGLPWDAILGAEVSRAYKPEPRVYLHAAEILDLPPAACMMVAAHNGDLRAARGAGLTTAFVPRPREHGPDQATDLAPEEAWDVVAADFGALADRLGA